jgi:Family of unknown function (DUF5763)
MLIKTLYPNETPSFITIKQAAMIKILFIWVLLLFASCFNKDSNTSETEPLNQRINLLEQRIDSLIRDMNTNSTGLNSKGVDSSLSSRTVPQVNRCQAITKKGTQCKRKAKNSGYCWQHEG